VIPPIPPHLALEIVTPDRAILHAEVDEVEIPAEDGYLGILPGHTPLLAALRVGELWYRRGQEKTYLSVAFGFVEVQPDRVTILAQVAERADEIDIVRAEAALRRAEAQLSRPAPDVDVEVARLAMLKALIRVQVAAKAGKRLV
jgi:F-type H+-transporting ATPase subunit epsilon